MPSPLSADWRVVADEEETKALTAELARELTEGHLLFGVAAVPVAAHRRRKECVYSLTDENTWARVHLTWSEETDPRWPSTEIFSSWAELVEALRRAGRS